MGQALVEWELCVDLDQFLSRVLVAVQLRSEHVEQRRYLLSRTQAAASRAHDRTMKGVGKERRERETAAAVRPIGSWSREVCCGSPSLHLHASPSCPTPRSQDVLCAGSSTLPSTPR